MLKIKAQIISIELMFSVIIILLLFGATIIIFQTETRKTIEEYNYETRKIIALSVLSELIETTGVPGNWNYLSSYEKPGLALNKKSLSKEKLERFKTEDMNSLMEKLLLNDAFYFYLEKDGNKIYEKGLDFDSEKNIVVQRNAFYNGESIKAVLKLFGLTEEGLIESSGTITPNIDCNEQKNFFSFDWLTSYFTLAHGKNLVNWTIKNIGINCGTLTIDKIRLEWINDTDGTTLKKIILNNVTVWQGTANSNEWIDITNFSIPALTSYSIGNAFEFSKDTINNESEDFRIRIQFTDNSTYVSGWFSP